MYTASGQEISHFKWKHSLRIVQMGWSRKMEAVFVTDDGSVFIYDLFGNLVRTFSMGQEAKDLKIIDARIFISGSGRRSTTGVAVLASSRRFFVVNNLEEPRTRKFFDVELPKSAATVPPPWDLLTDELQARIVIGRGHELILATLTDMEVIQLETAPYSQSKIRSVKASARKAHLAVLFEDGVPLFEQSGCGSIWTRRSQTPTKGSVFCANLSTRRAPR